MNKKVRKHVRVILVSLVVVISFFIYFHYQSEKEHTTFVRMIEEKRLEVDEFMKDSQESPFQDTLKESYSGLQYYNPNRQYRVQALIKPVENKEQLIIPTSDGKKQRYEKHAYAEFKLFGERYRLLLLKPVGFGAQDVIFTAFADATSGDETYGGGRYLDLKFKNARQITLDFNLAYNPYCAYNASFSCPLPPRENILPIPIRAGEKNYDP